MAKKTKKDIINNGIWEGIEAEAFENETNNIPSVVIEDFNKEGMSIYALNVICARHLAGVEDSLKPVERRILYTLYKLKAFGKTKTKSAVVVGDCSKIHPHGDGAIYNSLVGMAQSFKKNQRLVRGIGNFGSALDPTLYAGQRYTEVVVSDYAKECFFDDYDEDCVEVKESAIGGSEPVYLPSKFPHILINGVSAISMGYASSIPPYNIYDVVEATKKLITNKDTDIEIYPDLPTGCDLVVNGPNKYKMRSEIEITEEGNNWVLTVKSIPWLTNLRDIIDNLAKLSKSGVLPIKEVQNASYSYIEPNSKHKEISHKIRLRIIISKSYDPLEVKAKLLKTNLEKPLPMGLNVVQEGLQVATLSIKDLLLYWLNSRREYLRRLLIKKIAKLSARASLLEVMIRLTEKTNLEKTIKIIKESSDSELINNLCNYGKMDSYQAGRVAEMSLRAFTKEANARYKEELESVEKALNTTMETVKSEKKIDKIILDDMSALLRYAEVRKSKIVSNDVMELVSDNVYNIVFSKKGYVKKLPVVQHGRVKGCGTYSAGDYPLTWTTMNNRSDMTIISDTGKYSTIPVHTIPNAAPTDIGESVYRISKLDGSIISAFPAFALKKMGWLTSDFKNDIYMILVSSQGFLKKTNIRSLFEIDNEIAYKKNLKVTKLKDGDSLAGTSFSFDNSKIFVYTNNGNFVLYNIDKLVEVSKDGLGNTCIGLKDNEKCLGSVIVNITKPAKYIIVVTKKGYVKKFPTDSLGAYSRNKSSLSFTSLEVGDEIFKCLTGNDGDTVKIIMKNGIMPLDVNEIPELSKRAKGSKMIAIPNNDKLIDVVVNKEVK